MYRKNSGTHLLWLKAKGFGDSENRKAYGKDQKFVLFLN